MFSVAYPHAVIFASQLPTFQDIPSVPPPRVNAVLEYGLPDP
jgi:hypothetical protein